MKDSLFRKYFTFYALALVICTFTLGVALLNLATQYFKSDREKTLDAIAGQAATYTVQNFRLNGGYINRYSVENVYGLLGEATDSMVFFVDVSGTVRICSESDSELVGQQVPAEAVNAILSDGSYTDVGYMSNFFTDSGRYTVGVPVMISEGVVGGYVFASTPFAGLVDFLTNLFVMYQIAAIIMLAIAGVIIYYSTRKITEPLREMSKAVQSFGNGDFSVRVSDYGGDEISALAKVFNRMADNIEEMEKVRRSLVANVSHELRTPMTTIGGYIDGILDGTIPRKSQDHYLTIVSDEIKRLARLTESTLAVSRIEEGKLTINMAANNIWDIVCSVMFSAERRITQKNIRVREFSPDEAYVMCDADMLHQVIYNLVDNAIKFTPEGGEWSLTVHKNENQTLFSLRNSGPGIAKEELPFIFDRFYKTDKSRGMDKTGTGLGLYIVKTLVQRMDGDITVASVEGEYCEFTVMLKTAVQDTLQRDVKVTKPAKPPRARAGKNSFMEILGRSIRPHAAKGDAGRKTTAKSGSGRRPKE